MTIPATESSVHQSLETTRKPGPTPPGREPSADSLSAETSPPAQDRVRAGTPSSAVLVPAIWKFLIEGASLLLVLPAVYAFLLKKGFYQGFGIVTPELAPIDLMANLPNFLTTIGLVLFQALPALIVHFALAALLDAKKVRHGRMTSACLTGSILIVILYDQYGPPSSSPWTGRDIVNVVMFALLVAVFVCRHVVVRRFPGGATTAFAVSFLMLAAFLGLLANELGGTIAAQQRAGIRGNAVIATGLQALPVRVTWHDAADVPEGILGSTARPPAGSRYIGTGAMLLITKSDGLYFLYVCTTSRVEIIAVDTVDLTYQMPSPGTRPADNTRNGCA